MVQIMRLKHVLISIDHWQDVLAGSVLGIVTAYFAYRQYFPSLTSQLAHLPYAPRTQPLEGTHGHPAAGLPYYDRDIDVKESEVELLRDTVKRNEPERLEHHDGWEQGPGLESGPSHS